MISDKSMCVSFMVGDKRFELNTAGAFTVLCVLISRFLGRRTTENQMHVNKIITTLHIYFNAEISEARITWAPGELYLSM